MPTSDAQPSRLLPRRPQMISPNHLIPSSVPQASDSVPYPAPSASPLTPPRTSLPMRLPSSPSATELSENMGHEHALNFATHSWDLATGGLKTLTAKRELPTRIERHPTDILSDSGARSSARHYMFALIVLVCVIFMLIGGGVVLFVMLQP